MNTERWRQVAWIGLALIVVTLVVAVSVHAQVVQVTDLTGSGGLGVVVRVGGEASTGYVVTAAHVVTGDSRYRVTFGNGRKCSDARVLYRDEAHDVALVWTWIPDGVAAVVIAAEPAQRGEVLAGFGRDGRVFVSRVSLVNAELIFADAQLFAGDSGGPILNEKGELVGIISGGWFWIETRDEATGLRPTWPLRASGVGPIRKLLAQVDVVPAEGGR